MTIDFHAHCLPGMDDGAADIHESLQMLRDSVAQGISTVAATSHFCPGEESVSDFLQRRQVALEQLLSARDKDPALAGNVRIIPGAEVLVREGVSRLDLRPLCLQNSDILLLELPFAAPPVWLYEELENIVFEQNVRIMLAHVDRYMSWYSSEKLGYLMDSPGLIVQLTGDNIISRRAFRLLGRWLPETNRLVLGSDMHDCENRVQNLQTVCNRLRRSRLGRQWLSTIETSVEELVGEGSFVYL